eukprot:364680-Chlamydomonas_euryale.AAC.7
MHWHAEPPSPTSCSHHLRNGILVNRLAVVPLVRLDVQRDALDVWRRQRQGFPHLMGQAHGNTGEERNMVEARNKQRRTCRCRVDDTDTKISHKQPLRSPASHQQPLRSPASHQQPLCSPASHQQPLRSQVSHKQDLSAVQSAILAINTRPLTTHRQDALPAGGPPQALQLRICEIADLNNKASSAGPCVRGLASNLSDHHEWSCFKPIRPL